MSRRLNLRSPFFVKVTTDLATRFLSSATLHLYVWKGEVTDRTTTNSGEPRYSLSKNINPLQDFIVFEISELVRDEIDAFFDGADRDTEPVYIGVEIVKTYSNSDITDQEYNIFWGMDGYRDFAEGSDGYFNLINTPGDESLEAGETTISINVGGSPANINTELGATIPFVGVPTPTNSVVRWYRRIGAAEPVLLATNAAIEAKEFTIESVTDADVGTYYAISEFTSDTGSVSLSIPSNEIIVSIGEQTTTIVPAAGSDTIFESTTGDSNVFDVTLDNTVHTALLPGDFTFPSWLGAPTVGTASLTIGQATTYPVTFTTDEANTAEAARQGVISVFPTIATSAATIGVTQRGTALDDAVVTGIDATGDGVAEATHRVSNGASVTLVPVGASDLGGGDLTYQWYITGQTPSDRISGVTTATYFIPNTLPGTRVYSVGVTGASGITAFATITVTWDGNPVLVLNRSGDIRVETGETLEVSATVADTAGSTYTYLWEIDTGDGFGPARDAAGLTVTLGASTNNRVRINSATAQTYTVRATATSIETGLVSNTAAVGVQVLLVTTLTVDNLNTDFQLRDTPTEGWRSSDNTVFARQYLRAKSTFVSPFIDFTYEFNVEYIHWTSVSRTTQRTAYTAIRDLANVNDYFSPARFRSSPGIEYWTFRVTNPAGITSDEHFTLNWIDMPFISFRSGENVILDGADAATGLTESIVNTVGLSVGASVNTAATWISNLAIEVSPTTTNTHIVTYDIDANAGMLPRDATITATGSTASDSIIITQPGLLLGLITAFSGDTLDIDSGGERVTYSITANDSAIWEVSATGQDDIAGTGSDTITFDIPANTTRFSRGITVSLTVGGATTIDDGIESTISFEQRGAGRFGL